MDFMANKLSQLNTIGKGIQRADFEVVQPMLQLSR